MVSAGASADAAETVAGATQAGATQAGADGAEGRAGAAGAAESAAGAPPFWPDQVLDVPALRASGLRPLPFQEFLLKVHSRCNLACDYCYVYSAGDESWRTQPRRMSRETAELACRRIDEHVRAHGLREVRVILHGGEPLLAGPEFIDGLVRRLRALLPPDVRAQFTVQTNGTLVDDAVLALCHAHGIRIGVSLDGDRAGNDLHRRSPSGAGSHDAVAGTLRRLGEPRHRPLWAGLLCTVDVDADPAAVYRHLMSFRPPSIDLLLPLANWGRPPQGRAGGERDAEKDAAPYADWLGTVFDLWYHAPRQPTRIPFFEGILDGLLGGRSGVESVGGGPARMVVIETDGTLTQSDLLKTAYPGAPWTGRDVRHDALDTLLDHPGFVARQLGREALGEECLACPVVEVCGGGLYAHRYRPGSGFRHPSVYSADLRALITHVAAAVGADLARLGGGRRG